MERHLDRIAEARGALTADGRRLLRAAPGLRTVARVRENAAVAERGPLPPERMERIQALLGEPQQV